MDKRNDGYRLVKIDNAERKGKLDLRIEYKINGFDEFPECAEKANQTFATMQQDFVTKMKHQNHASITMK